MTLVLSLLSSPYPPQADKSMGSIDDLRRFNYIFIGPVTTVCHTTLKKFVILAQISSAVCLADKIVAVKKWKNHRRSMRIVSNSGLINRD
jgi:hypothetical protein